MRLWTDSVWLGPNSQSRQPLGCVLHSSNEPGELSQLLRQDDSTINIDGLTTLKSRKIRGEIIEVFKKF